MADDEGLIEGNGVEPAEVAADSDVAVPPFVQPSVPLTRCTREAVLTVAAALDVGWHAIDGTTTDAVNTVRTVIGFWE